jgi:UDP-N-acetylglucosamine 2-epimerase (non-hydrolysing)
MGNPGPSLLCWVDVIIELKRIDLIAGARPNFMKIASVIDAINSSRRRNNILDYRLIHTGQHYDQMMSGEFFNQLRIPEPDVNLEVGPGSQAVQTGNIMVRYEEVLRTSSSDACVVVGDVTSTMACAIVARKMGLPVAHVEAGIRSGDWSMPEEINRVVTDSLSNWFFVTSQNASENLRKAGVAENEIFFVGNTMIDTLLKNLQRLRAPPVWFQIHLEPKQFFVLTLHRPANVDESKKLQNLLEVIARATRNMPVIFPVHPRTAKALENLRLNAPHIHYIEPLGYLEFNYLVKQAKAVLTDSGGITEEATILGVPCLTLRETTERPETVTIGTNELVGSDPARVQAALERLFERGWKIGSTPPRWDGKAGQRIVSILEQVLSQQS